MGATLTAWLALPAAADSAPPRLRILTYNIHHGEGTDGRFDLSRVAAIISAAQPDLVALQEVDRETTRAGGIDQLGQLEYLTGLHAAFGRAMAFEGGSYGVAVLSKLPIRSAVTRALPGAADREPRVVLTVDVEPGASLPALRFATTHLDQGRNGETRLAQAHFLNTALADGDAPVILAGDMNSQVDSAVLDVLRQSWADLFTAPDPIGPTGRPRRRVDHVLGRPMGWTTLDAGTIDDRLASDHRPVLVTLEWDARVARGGASGPGRAAAALGDRAR
jgi:endonuclease/exonuclease/phosphatase family metal-dependent hydrolase